MSSGTVEEEGLLLAGGKAGLLCSVMGIDEDRIPEVEDKARLVLIVGRVEGLSSVGAQDGGELLVE